MKILITGGAGFIGSHVVRLFVTKYPEYQIFNLDKLTYAGNLENLKDIEDKPNYTFIKGDIVDEAFMNEIFRENQFDAVIHIDHTRALEPLERSSIWDIGEPPETYPTGY